MSFVVDGKWTLTPEVNLSDSGVLTYLAFHNDWNLSHSPSNWQEFLP